MTDATATTATPAPAQASASSSSWFKPWGKKRPSSPEEGAEKKEPKHPKWSMGVLNDPETIEVPGSVLLLASHKNQPLGMRHTHARNSHSTIPTGFFDPEPEPEPEPVPQEDDKKKTKDGKFILEPQPEDSANDPLNWPKWRRDTSLFSLGFYCMVGGGITPLLAAGFYNVADDYGVSVEDVSLTTGLYMMGLGLGSVVASPTAILYGKRPVYLFSALLFIVASIWCAVSPTFGSLVAARVFQGIAISPVECLPSATIAEIYFLHERAYRIGIYTLLLLGGKNLVPLLSAAIIQGLSWRWVFWIISFIVAFGFVMLFFFVPETFWDRSPVPHARLSRRHSRRPSFIRRMSSRHGSRHGSHHDVSGGVVPHAGSGESIIGPEPVDERATHEQMAETPSEHPHKHLHVGFAGVDEDDQKITAAEPSKPTAPQAGGTTSTQDDKVTPAPSDVPSRQPSPSITGSGYTSGGYRVAEEKIAMPTDISGQPASMAYTHRLRHQPPKSFSQQLKVWNGRLNHDKWFKVMLRPFILYSYPAVLWSTVIYSCSVGWLIVISNTMSMIYRTPEPYGFTPFQTGLVYLSPFIGGILGTAVAGKISDVVVKALARRNGGLYEPEFRLVMAIPITITTTIGLMGFGWSAEIGNHYMVPTVFFGIVSFGCSLGSTTAITFCVDSYRQYAGEALVTLNFSKNVLHGLVFSLFVTHWMKAEGSKNMYMWLGIIQLILCLFSIPMFIYGKRARMWTVRKNMMEKF
ncbi:MFS1 family protein [Plectosphaerella plurivora]|uniref:MFS1 family protein n=1 Tax=Plectosphaerella plurivora TaxID=936078 RepID=A0A9P9A802_9PEZI|nr:MFS1 family protein [Plectosphaerella plurivora]